MPKLSVLVSAYLLNRILPFYDNKINLSFFHLGISIIRVFI